jgi:hypothetical protein
MCHKVLADEAAHIAVPGTNPCYVPLPFILISCFPRTSALGQLESDQADPAQIRTDLDSLENDQAKTKEAKPARPKRTSTRPGTHKPKRDAVGE